ncbi:MULTISPECIES: triphosphoribosyl-dephospho-CoA synthase [Methanosarcina]|uniref:Triphosphoribosyl-dephospho-CoA synthetase n=3 Tax=Methanosarcina barkeri TaxID=2208 RepID=A0A0E3QWG9_METBA|nr:MULTISPECIES: triphosphoribosyl-dephospho-CoA synthase [Methanosarcina]AKB55839.1 Triphosphoribosyl-dephospho-CoA synthetase [Methanosarcina barkeri MS]AKB59315.1 Triphosphoribosyl-dephospho-CoA synthetase [Methanosarcina barkeri 227]AKJ39978.1 triphosphoribosyl-dephospho-CoA synthetase [Methanosarcina barkeri CM1]OED10212.1 fumarate hydratase [Methanosarcina sp. A14]
MNPINNGFTCQIPELAEKNPQISNLIARCAQLAMLLEVSASPKPGNVDREHNYPDTCFEHFIASSVGVYPVLELAARSRNGIGALIRSAVCESSAWQKGGNTHFGAFLLLIPLSMAAGELFDSCGKAPYKLLPDEFEALAAHAHAFVQATDSEDAVEFYRAFEVAGVRVNSVDEFSLGDPKSTDKLRDQDVTLYELMDIARGYDLIANEWVTGFGSCLEGAKCITEFMQAQNPGAENSVSNCSGTGINEAVVYTFLKLLSRHRDTFIETKFDKDTADYVSSRAGEILSAWEEASGNTESLGNTTRNFAVLLPAVQEFDSELLKKRINPGSTADIIIAGLFIALLGGLRF